MDCFSPGGLLLPFWLGKAMAALLRAVWIVPGLGFPCQLFLLCHPLLLSHSWPSHLSQPGWEALGCHSRASEEGAIK